MTVAPVSYSSQVAQLIKLVTPSMVINLLEISTWVTDLIMLGRLGKGHLAAGSIAFSIYNMIWVFIEGTLSALDTFGGRAAHAKDLRALREWSYTALVAVAIISFIATIIVFVFIYNMNRILPENGNTASQADEFLLMLIPVIWLSGGFRVIQKYLLCQNKLMPGVYALILASLFNIVGGYDAPRALCHMYSALATLLC